MPEVVVVIPARDAAATIGAALDGVAAQTVAAEVIVVDNGSLDDTAAIAEARGVRVIRRERGAGPGAARNDGVAATAAPVIAFTDADCVPTPAWLEHGLRALATADLIQGRVDPDPAGVRHPFEHTVSVTAAWGLFETANLFVRRAWFDRVGGFGAGVDAAGRPFGEDVLFGWAIRRAGGRTGFAPDAIVHHAVFQRDWRALVAERGRLRHFPGVVRAAPELRHTFLRQGLFLTAGTRRTDLALAGLLAAAASELKSSWWGRSAAHSTAARVLGVAAAAPYAVDLRRRVRRWPQHRPLPLAAALVAADLRGAAALLTGSLRARRAVL